MRGREPSGRTTRGVACLGLAALLPLVVGAPSRAGTLDVNAGAKFAGSFGLEVDTTASCIWPQDLTVGGPTVEGVRSACGSLVADGVEVGAAGATLEAGDSIKLGEEFFSPDNTELIVKLVDPQVRFAFVTDDSPTSETVYRAEYRVNLDGLSIGGSDAFSNLSGLSANGVTHFRVMLKRNAALTENRLVLEARQDDGTLEQTASELLLPAGWNQVEIRWAAGVGYGYLLASIDGSVFTGLTLLDNDRARIDTVRWGAVDGTADATTGTFSLDAFESN